MRRELDDFLRTIQSRARGCEGIVGNGRSIRLNGGFWAFAEIESGLKLRRDWGISEDLVPFYGDWHDVFCLSLSTCEVIYLDDDRRTIATWRDTETFMESLTQSAPTVSLPSTAKLVDAHLSPALKSRVDEILRSKKS